MLIKQNCRKWWEDRKGEYPYHATGQGDPIKVHKEISGNHISVPIVDGGRLWGFKTAAARSQFCEMFEGKME